MTLHTHTGPELDEDGKPIFMFEGCECPSCMILRAQHDSWKIEMIARLGRLLQRHRARLRLSEFELALLGTDFKRVTANFAEAARGASEALEKWEPALPVMVH